MNNEDKRFKQINRIATPIKIEEQIEKLEEFEPKEEITSIDTSAKKKKEIKPDLIFKILIILLIIGIVASSLYLILPSINNSNKLKYNDITTTKEMNTISVFLSVNLSNESYLTNGNVYKASNIFNISINNKNIEVNGKNVATAQKVLSSVGLIEDLLLFTKEDNDKKTLYIVDKYANVILELNDLNGKKIMNSIDAISYTPTNVIIKASSVSNDIIYLDNMNVSICDDETLANKVINLNTSVITYYSLSYLENHKFSELSSTYDVNLYDYRVSNGYCN